MTVKLYTIGDIHYFGLEDDAKKFEKKLIKLGQEGKVSTNNDGYKVVVSGNYGPRRANMTDYKRGIKGNFIKKTSNIQTKSQKKDDLSALKELRDTAKILMDNSK